MKGAIWTKAVSGCAAVLAASGGVAQVAPPTPSTPANTAHPAEWPGQVSPIPRDPAIEARIDRLLAAMSLEQKVGQVVQGDIASITPEDVRRYHLGSVFNGGNSDPHGQYNAPAKDWLALADAFWDASITDDPKLPRIPAIWGIDAVHGHSNIVGATLFPHNIGLGAMRDPELMRKIGEVTAIEMRVTGIDWTFAPTIAVVRDDRWGRTYEGFGEVPEIAASYAGPLVEGLQGKVGGKDWLTGPHVIATAKHFLGDGGTLGGRDQGDAQVSEAQLRDLFAPPYEAALKAGVQSVMVSFSSWNGRKMTGNDSLLTGVVKQRWGFDGFLVGDWNAHGQVEGCTNTDCPQAINAGLDIYMAPDSWKGIWESTLREVRSGAIPMRRLDDAVRRVLRVKFRAGIFDAVKPSARPYAGRYELLGSPEHRAVARQAVRESLVLLKNAGSLLPLKPGARILVTGDGADNVAKQAGGWTLSWQGTGTTPADFPNATSIWQGIRETVRTAGGTATLSPDGSFAAKPDAAIVVFGENPYAEFQGDRSDVAFDDAADTLAAMKRLKAVGVPVVAVFLSGRPLWVNPWLNAADAFVAAWLPGSEGGGVADVLFGKAEFRGKLPFSWPKRSDQTPLNVGDAGYDPLFSYGFGLTTRDRGDLPALPEVRAGGGGDAHTLFTAGKATNGRRLLLGTGDALAANPGPELIAQRPADRVAQEDSVRITWTGRGAATAALVGDPVDLTREANGDVALIVTLHVAGGPASAVTLGGRDVTARLRALAERREWGDVAVPLRCFTGTDLARVTRPFAMSTAGALDVTVSQVRLGSPTAGLVDCR
ncbi:glycoside hydrolase family 3 N-terminal domain-containing protein [Sphingomonas sp. DT-204]|uniref:glycoside hydrolase family 3 protein n=1 Tax=Sphingomonas sp. DT-204 TaxID=3396166 RepID=UPI003F1B7690